SGRVQGVFFRHETKLKAMQNNVTGWVRNLPDGRVEAVFEGDKEAVEAMIEFCQRGPPGAKVENVEVIWENPTNEFKDFRIRY
ncbi:MAG: acylphosphatase, partial [Candidatus Bathyarchaeia archaeon]